MVGNANDAALAGNSPVEFFLDEGCSRAVFLINDVVYKIEHDSFYHENLTEFDKMRNNRPKTFAFPEVSMYGNVLAMECIVGIPTGACYNCCIGEPCPYGDCLPFDIISEAYTLGIEDTAHGNFILANGVYYCVDAVS